MTYNYNLFYQKKRKKNRVGKVARKNQMWFFVITKWAMAFSLMVTILNCSNQRTEDICRYVPEDIFMVFTINFQKLTQLGEYNELSGIWDEHFEKEIMDEKFDNFINIADIDFKRDLLKATFVFSFDTNIFEPQFAFIINGNYKKEKLLSAMKDNHIDVTDYTYNNNHLIKINNDKPQDVIFLGFLDSSHLVFGMENQVQKILDVKDEKIKSIKENEKMKKFSKIYKDDNDYALAMILFIPDNIRREEAAFQQMPIDFSSIESFIFILNSKSTVIRLLSSDYEKNNKLVAFLNGLKLMFSAMQPKSNTEKFSLEIFNDSSIKTEEDEIIISIPTEKFLPPFIKILKDDFLINLEKGKQMATMEDLKSIGWAIESYMTDYYHAPEGKSLADIKDKLEPFYIKELPLRDAWGNNFIYSHGTGENQDVYSIASPGRNAIFNGWEQSGYYIITHIDDFGNDIIFSNGTFTYGPRVE